MDIQVGDRVTYKAFDEIKKILIIDNGAIDDMQEAIKNNNIEILKIERPHYEVVEEKKELLTEEEREFLRYYIKIIKNLNNGNIYGLLRTEEDIKLILDTSITYKIEVGSQFSNMKVGEKYTLKELGLEED